MSSANGQGAFKAEDVASTGMLGLSRLFVDASQDSAIFLTDGRGLITSWSVGATRIEGYQAGQILGKHISILYPPEDSASGKPERNLRRAVEQGCCVDEGWRVRKSGERFWAKVIMAALRDKEGGLSGFAKVTFDLTEQKRMTEELRQGEERFQSLFQNLQVGATIAGPRGKLLACNQTARDLLGLTEDPGGKVSFDPKREVLYPDHSTCSFENGPIQRVIAGKKPVRNQLLGITSPTRRGMTWMLVGAEPLLAEDGSVSQVLTTYVDMTKPKLAADLVVERENRFRAAIQASGQILYDWNPGAGEVTFGGRVQETLGYDPAEMGGRLEGWIDLIHAADRARFRAEIERVTAAGEAFRLQFRMRRKDGVYITVRSNGFFFLDPVQGRSRMIGFISDVSERLQLEERLKRAQRLEGIGQVTGGVAHDFNNILAVIQGHSAVLCAGLSSTSPLRQAAEGIEKAAGLAVALTGQLLARNRTSEPREVDLNRVVRNMESMLRRLLGGRIELRFVLNAGGPVRAAPERTEQVILNLVVNARDAMPAGGTLTIETADGPGQDGRSPYVMLAVTDTGSGMDAETRDRAFDPFFTTKDDGKGTGLGLSTVYGIVRQSGGYIRVRTEPERGSVFETYWRRADEISADGTSTGDTSRAGSCKEAERPKPSPRAPCLSKTARARRRKGAA